MRLSSFFAPIRRSIAKLLPSSRAKPAPKHTLRPITDFFTFAPSKPAPKYELRPITDFFAFAPSKPAPKYELRPITDFIAFAPQTAAVQRAPSLGLAERHHIRAKFALRRADLNLHQVARKYGSGSPQAARAANLRAKADVALGAAAGSLYASRILLGDDLV